MAHDRKFQLRVVDGFEETLLRLQAAARVTNDFAAHIARLGIEEKVEQIEARDPERFKQALREVAEASAAY